LGTCGRPVNKPIDRRFVIGVLFRNGVPLGVNGRLFLARYDRNPGAHEYDNSNVAKFAGRWTTRSGDARWRSKVVGLYVIDATLRTL
jgi:hypothetical protein